MQQLAIFLHLTILNVTVIAFDENVMVFNIFCKWNQMQELRILNKILSYENIIKYDL